MDIQELLLAAVQAQPFAADTFTCQFPPITPKSCPASLSENVQPPAWLIVKVIPAAVTVPCLAGPVFGATDHKTTPLPLPLLPDVIVIQLALLVAVQAQPPPAITLTPSLFVPLAG